MSVVMKRFLSGSLCAVLAAWFCCQVQVTASEGEATLTSWPMFRGGPSLQGVSPGALPDKPVLKWSFKVGDPIKSSAAIEDGLVFIGADNGVVYALDLLTGKEKWQQTTDGLIESSPLVLGDRVFIGSSDGYLYAFEKATGKPVWKYETDDQILGAPNWVKSPDGKSFWIVTGSYDYFLHCVDAETGKGVWKYETGNYINGAPAVSDGKTVFGGCDALLHVISLADGTKVNEIEAGAYIPGSAAMDGDRVYVGHYESEFLCFDLKEAALKWNYRDRNFPYYSSPAITDKWVIVGGRDKRLHCLDRETGKDRWKFSTRGKVDSSPVVSRDKIVVGSSDGRLYIVSLSEGKELWSYEIGESIIASPAVIDQWIVVGAEDGFVYAFGK
jgi:eukaryotic-like serine/threonine-protein kinase